MKSCNILNALNKTQLLIKARKLTASLPCSISSHFNTVTEMTKWPSVVLSLHSTQSEGLGNKLSSVGLGCYLDSIHDNFLEH